MVMDALAVDRARVGDITDAFADGTLSREQFARANARVQQRIADAEAELRDHDALGPISTLPVNAAALAPAWDAMTIDERRHVLAALVKHVDVLPAEQPVRVWNPNRLQPRWRW
jgi:hypothetical protein